MLVEEQWKDIEGYEGLYQISNLGRVKSLKRWRGNNGSGYYTKEKILKNSKKDNDYLMVGLSKNGKSNKFYVHRLVAIAFIPNPHDYPLVNHKKEFEKYNNNIENLEWCTYKYNLNYGTRKERHDKAISKIIYQYTENMVFIKEWKSSMECRRSGLAQKSILDCCNGRKATYKKCLWLYNPIITKEELV